jgi:cytochrome c oxidase subunit 2
MKPFTLKWALPLFLLGGAVPAFSKDFITNPASDYGTKIADLSYLMGTLCAIFFLLVVGIIAYCLWKFRATGPKQEGAAIHGHTGLEIVWTVVPALIMIGLGVVSTILVFDQLNPPKKSLLVKVTGYQFGWKFDYYESDASAEGSDVETVRNICGNPSVMVKIKKLNVSTEDEMTIPKDTDIRFLTTSTDVIHSFWVPEFLIKRDMVPGLIADIWVHPSRAGDFTAKCAALCGANHGIMTAKVHVVEAPDFQTWLTKQAGVAGLVSAPKAN